VKDYPTTLVRVEISEGSVPDFESARTKLQTAAQDFGAADVWVISQSLGDELVFEFYRGTLPANFERSIAGRVFSPKGELRWLRDSSGCRFWKTVESSDGTRTFRKRERRYYLWGMRTKDGSYSENRTVGAFHYPIPAANAGGEQVDDRAFIVVAEYLAAEPVSWQLPVAEVQAILNQPEIVAHRYLQVGSGRTK
jgi:hypothetical protein